MSEQRCVVHFDHHSAEHAANPLHALADLRRDAPIAWSDAYGGFWIATRYEDVVQAARDSETFSSFNDLNMEDVAFSGVVIPPNPVRFLPLELDQPLLGKHRKMLAARMAPPRARNMQQTYEDWADYFIDQFITDGHVEFISQLVSPVPAIATLAFLGLPVDDFQVYSETFHDLAATLPGTPERDRALAGLQVCQQRVAAEVADRRRHPRDDALTDLVNGEIDGVGLPEDEIMDWVSLILGGGIDTTTALLGHSLIQLDQRPELRQSLRDDPKALELFMEEMLRIAAPTQAVARTATRDVELGGQLIRRGERVLLSWASANCDEAVFDEADNIVTDRKPNPHTSFGIGPHRCIGSHFARIEYVAILSRILTRLPDFRIDTGARSYDSVGVVNGWAQIPATFTPGPVLGVPFRSAAEAAQNESLCPAHGRSLQ